MAKIYVASSEVVLSLSEGLSFPTFAGHAYLVYDPDETNNDTSDQLIIRGGSDINGNLVVENGSTSSTSKDGLDNDTISSNGFAFNDKDRDGNADTEAQRNYTQITVSPTWQELENFSATLTDIFRYDPVANLDDYIFNSNSVFASVLSYAGLNPNLYFPGSYTLGFPGDKVRLSGSGSDHVYGWEGDNVFYDKGGSDYFYGGNSTNLVVADLTDGEDIFNYGGGWSSGTALTADVEVFDTHMTIRDAVDANEYDTLYSIEVIKAETYSHLNKVDFSAFTNGAISATVKDGVNMIELNGNAGTLYFQNFGSFVGSSVNNSFLLNRVDGYSFDGAGGVDTVSYAWVASSNGMTIKLNDQTAFITGSDLVAGPGGGPFDEILNFENVTGSSFNDYITGNDSDNILYGGAGDDTLVGGAGNDTIEGGAGIDTVDYANEGGSAGITASMGGTGWSVNDTHGDTDTLSGIETITFTGFNDTLTIGDIEAGQRVKWWAVQGSNL